MKKITLCADDFSYNDAISHGIIKLIEKQRITAVSCMTTTPGWPKHATLLAMYKNKIDIGLHINLTEALVENQVAQSLVSLISSAFLRRLDKRTITAQIQQQLYNFAKNLGFLPDFIDGHQHVHHLPTIRDLLLTICQQQFTLKKPYIRVSANGIMDSLFALPNFPKQQLIALTGALKLKALLQKQQLPYNRSFAGIYHFTQAQHYRNFFQNFLQNINHQGLIMCHPGLITKDNADPLARSRYYEYQYLSSDAFLQDCRHYNIEIGRFTIEVEGRQSIY